MTELQRLTDQVQALAGQPTVVLEGRAYTLPARPLVEWLAALLTAEPDSIVPGLLSDDDAVALYDRLLDEWEPLDPEVCQQAGLWVVEQVAGRPTWEVGRLVQSAMSSWTSFDGWAAAAGLAPLDLPLSRFCNLFHHYARTVLSGDALEDWQQWLTTPPALSAPEVLEAAPEWQDDAMGDAFASVFGEHNALQLRASTE